MDETPLPFEIPPPDEALASAEEPLSPGQIALCLCESFREFPGSSIAPEIPEALLSAFLPMFQDLRDDEELLAIVRNGENDRHGSSCVLTTRRIYWLGPMKASDVVKVVAGAPNASMVGRGSSSCQSLAYEEFQSPPWIETIGVAHSIDLGEGRPITLGGHQLVLNRLLDFLDAMGRLARGWPPVLEIPQDVERRARWSWPAVVRQTEQARSIRTDFRKFRALHTHSGVVATPILFVACLGIYLAMLFYGISPISPNLESMLDWGANFGPSLVFDHQTWRLVTCNFLHFGLIHLAMNLWCLASIGPAVERFYGSLSYAALYLLAGVGGSIASTWWNPTLVSAGASGAIFGIIGGLIAFLIARRRDVPTAMLKSMRSGVSMFVLYNLGFGMLSARIDKAGHIGGLVAGFVVGLMLMLAGSRSGAWAGSVRRLVVVVSLSVGLALLAGRVIDRATAKILADPKMGPVLNAEYTYGPQWNGFNDVLQPLLAEFTDIESKIDQIGQDIERDVPNQVLIQRVDILIGRLSIFPKRIEAIPAKNEEIRKIREQLPAARNHLQTALVALKKFLRSGDERQLDEPDGFRPSINAYHQDFDVFTKLRDDYFQAHGLVLEPDPGESTIQKRP